MYPAPPVTKMAMAVDLGMSRQRAPNQQPSWQAKRTGLAGEYNKSLWSCPVPKWSAAVPNWPPWRLGGRPSPRGGAVALRVPGRTASLFGPTGLAELARLGGHPVGGSGRAPRRAATGSIPVVIPRAEAAGNHLYYRLTSSVASFAPSLNASSLMGPGRLSLRRGPDGCEERLFGERRSLPPQSPEGDDVFTPAPYRGPWPPRRTVPPRS